MNIGNCKTCGVKFNDRSDQYLYIPQIKDGDCFDCYHWTEVFNKQGLVSVRTSDHEHRSFSESQPLIDTSKRKYGTMGMGSGGRRFTITFTDGRENNVIVTNDLWCQGTLSKHWSDKYPPNAVISG